MKDEAKLSGPSPSSFIPHSPFPIPHSPEIAVHTSSRLHFGLLGLEDATPWRNREEQPTLPGRAFGGVGLMVEDPGIRLRVSPAPSWTAVGPLAERALAFAHRYAAAVRVQHADLPLPCQRLAIECAAPEHAGLGTGTQLGLTTARALSLAWGLDETVPVLARRVGRGQRSAIGVHGFERGGLLVESGKRRPDDLSPLVAHVAFPEDWRVLLILPSQSPGLHGPRENEAFNDLARHALNHRQTESLCRLVLQGLLPALVERDLEAFGECLYDFNARSGELFAAVQGGVYATPAVAEMVAYLRALGIRGVGQSSWGPTVFAVVESEERAADLALRLRERFGLNPTETVVTRACNQGARIS
jgi:beta-ribofuranosylaminobenzene 5'-phosphate synthase